MPNPDYPPELANNGPWATSQTVCENVGVQSNDTLAQYPGPQPRQDYHLEVDPITHHTNQVQNYPEPPSATHNARDPWTQMCNQEKFENLLQRMYKLESQMKEQWDTIYRQQRALAEHQHKQDGGVVVPYR